MKTINPIPDTELYQYDQPSVSTIEPVLSWVNVIGREELKFMVRACEDARLVLTATPGETFLRCEWALHI